MVSLEQFFKPKRIAVIGVSRNPNKVGHVLFKNLIEGGFDGEVVPVNPSTEQILHYKVYSSILKVKQKIDLAVIAVPAQYVLSSVQECYKVGVRHLLIVSAGFGEIGNKTGEEEIRVYLEKNKMRAIGVNCLGIYDAWHKLDALFIPRYRLKRPKAGGIGFVCQSGAIGAAIVDIATEQGHGFSTFVSYGNATDVDESDLLEYLGNDPKTKVICLYLEGIKNGEKFYRIAREVSKKKPIIAIKGGLSEAGSKAAMSHTGSLAGMKEAYMGIFKQTGIIYAQTLEEMFDIASLVEKEVHLIGNRIQVITNGGGYGIISTDVLAASKHLQMATLSPSTQTTLKHSLPETVSVHNPLDLVGDATSERYRIALEACGKDKGIDGIVLVVLYQTPLIGLDIIDVISEFHHGSKKPLLVVSTGGEFTENLSDSLEEQGIPTFRFPENAIHALDKLAWYTAKRNTL